MAQQVKVLAAKPNDVGLISRIHVGEERTDSSKLSSDLHMSIMAYVPSFLHTQTADRYNVIKMF